MSDELYQRLRKGIAKHSVFFDATPTGVEIKFLKKLFTEEEAELYLHLTENLDPPEKIAERAGQDVDKVAVTLKGMAKKKGWAICMKACLKKTPVKKNPGLGSISPQDSLSMLWYVLLILKKWKNAGTLPVGPLDL